MRFLALLACFFAVSPGLAQIGQASEAPVELAGAGQSAAAENLLLQEFDRHLSSPPDAEARYLLARAADSLIDFYVRLGRYADAEQISAQWLADIESGTNEAGPSSSETQIDQQLSALRERLEIAERTYGSRAAETLAVLTEYRAFGLENYLYDEAASASLRIGRVEIDYDHVELEGLEHALMYQAAGRFYEAETVLSDAIRNTSLGNPDRCPVDAESGFSCATSKPAVDLMVELLLVQGRIAEAGAIDRAYCTFERLRRIADFQNVSESLRRELEAILPVDCARASVFIAEGNLGGAEIRLRSDIEIGFLSHRLDYDGNERPAPEPFLLRHEFSWFSPPVTELADLYHLNGRVSELEEMLQEIFRRFDMFQTADFGSQDEHVDLPRALHWALNRFGIRYDILDDQFQGGHSVTGYPVIGYLDGLALRDRLARSYQRQGRGEEAEIIYRESLLASTRLHVIPRRGMRGTNPMLLTFIDRLANLYSEQNRLDEAETLYSLALNISRAGLGTSNPLTLAISADMARTALSSDSNLDVALSSSRLLAARYRTEEQRGPLLATRVSQEAQQGNNLPDGPLLVANALWQSNSQTGQINLDATAEAWIALQEAITSPANQAVVQMATQRLADQQASGLSETIRERDRLAQLLDGQYLAALGPDGTGVNRDGPVFGELARLESQIAEIDTRLRDEFPNYFALIRPRATTLSEAQALLDDASAILLVVPTEFGTHVVAVSADDVRWHRSDWTREDIQSAATRLRWDLGATVSGPEQQFAEWEAELVPGTPYGYSRSVAYALYLELFGSILDVLEGKNRLFVVSGDELSGLPFSVLVAEEPSGPDNNANALRNTAWLADRFALSHIPSVQSLDLMSQANSASQPDNMQPLAGFGDPLLSGTAQQRGLRNAPSIVAEDVLGWQQSANRGRMANTERLRQLARLPGTAIEIESIRIALGAPEESVWLGARATETAIRNADLSQARIIAFATHGLMPRDLSTITEPGLVFTPPMEATDADDGYLSASEVAALHLNAEWVILSACNTATGDQGPGLSSLARSFFYAGAHNLLASHWPVNDEVASRITVRTLEILRDNQTFSRAQAFQHAMIEIRNDASHDTNNASWAHPAYWAPFVLIGGIDRTN